MGDALSDMLAVETILRHRKWSIQQWDQIYTDFPSRQLKVSVKDRSLIETTDAERKCVAPRELQPAIDEIVSRYKSARCFVRWANQLWIRMWKINNLRNPSDHLEQRILWEFMRKPTLKYERNRPCSCGILMLVSFQESVDQLAAEVAKVVTKLCN